LRGLGRAFGDHFPHRAWGAVAQAADGLESAMEALFIQLDVRDGAGLTAACPPARDGTLKEAFDVPGAQPHQLPAPALHLPTHPHVNGEALQEQGKASARFGPRQADGMDATLGAVDARRLRLEQGLELAGIQMPPGPSLRMIGDRGALLTTRAREEALAGALG